MMSRRRLVLLAVTLAVVLGGGALALVGVGREEEPAKPPASPLRTTAFYDVHVGRAALPAQSYRGAVARLGDHVLFSTTTGQLFRIAYEGEGTSITELDLAVPLDYEHPSLAHFLDHHVSIFDIATEAVSGQENAYDLYASHLGLDAAGECVYLALSHVLIRNAGTSVEALTDWKEIFRSEPCLPLAVRTKPGDLTGHNGGRIAFDDEDVVLTVGTFGMDAQLPESDYGKIVRLPRDTYTKTTISTGHRNQQGLLVDNDGTIIATEHGPRGGDEINVILAARDYGWPQVSLGTEYEDRVWVSPWSEPTAAIAQARHEGFEKPLFAFVPSIGISQIIRVASEEQFPYWHGDLLVASLIGNTLYRVHVVDGRVLFVEPIFLEERLRDMVELPDGRIAILTDGEELLTLSNAGFTLPTEDGENSEAGSEAHDYFSAQAIDEERLGRLLAAARAEGDAARGETLYEQNCVSCHATEPGIAQQAPSLACAFGSPVAGGSDYGYSAELRRFRRAAWVPENLDRLLENAVAFTRGTSMGTIRMGDPGERADLIAYLALVRQQNCPG